MILVGSWVSGEWVPSTTRPQKRKTLFRDSSLGGKDSFVSYSRNRASQVVLVIKNVPANSGDIRDMGSIPGLGRSPGGGLGNPLWYPCLENPTNRGAWRAPWGHRESDATEWLLLSLFHFSYHLCMNTNFILSWLGEEPFSFWEASVITILFF